MPRILPFALLLAFATQAPAQRQMETLDRGVIAVRPEKNDVFVSWRLLASDPPGTAFNLYRAAPGKDPVKLNQEPLAQATCFNDSAAPPPGQPVSYSVRPFWQGREYPASPAYVLPADSADKPFLEIPLTTPEGYTANDAAPGDLDGDGRLDLVIKEEKRGHDNSQSGLSGGTTKLAGYTVDGKFLWRIDLGKNIREGAHYTPFLVYDFDGDGVAEIVVRTAEGTTDGTGQVIGDTNGDNRTDYVNPRTGYVLEGPEFLSVFNGRTGREMARVPYIPRGKVTDWGDAYGNRCDRFLMAVAYLDGKHPSIIMCRGYYALTKLEAWDWKDGKLSRVWSFSSSDAGHSGYAGQGNHNLRVGDVDGDGKDEIIYGACCIDDNGKGLYTTGLGHGDAIHFSDLDPDHPGLEVMDVHEHYPCRAGLEFRDAKSGKLLWGVPSNGDVGRGMAADIDPRHKGAEMWAFGGGIEGLFTCKGEKINPSAPRSCDFAIWWDGDLLRELLNGTSIDKWDWKENRLERLVTGYRFGAASNNGTKATPCLSCDFLGDWREEALWRSADSKRLLVFTTTIPTAYRFTTLMQDPVYRLDQAFQNSCYNQPPHTGYYLGEGMAPPPRPALQLVPNPGVRPGETLLTK